MAYPKIPHVTGSEQALLLILTHPPSSLVEELAQLDRVPTPGFIHHPSFVTMADADGKPLTRRD